MMRIGAHVIVLLAALAAGCSQSPTSPTPQTASAGKEEVGPRRQAALAPWCDRRVQCDCKELDADLEVIFRACSPYVLEDPPYSYEPDPDPCPQPDPLHPVSCPTYDCRTSGCPEGGTCVETPGAPLPFNCVAESPF